MSTSSSPTPEPPESKGHGFNTTVRALRGMLDAERFAAVIAALPSETARLIERPPTSVAWLALDHFATLVDTAGAVGFDGDVEPLTELGRRAIGADLNSVYRLFIKIASPDFVIQRAAKLWAVYNRNNGTLVAERNAPDSVDLVYEGLCMMTPRLWAYQRGAILAVVDATRLKQPAVDIIGGGGREPQAVLRVTWR